MNRAEILALLEKRNIPYELIEHPAIYTIEEGKAVHMPHGEDVAKNLFLRDDKKRNYYLLTVKEEKHVDLKSFSVQQSIRRLSFASEDDLMKILELPKGSVTPFGLLNDTEDKVLFYLDQDFCDQSIGIHPNDNTATVWMKTSDLIEVLTSLGHPVHTVSIQ